MVVSAGSPHSEYWRAAAPPQSRSAWAPGCQAGSGDPSAACRMSAATPSVTASLATTVASVSASVPARGRRRGSGTAAASGTGAASASGIDFQTYMLGELA